MPDVWTPDDLRFALIRAAHLESPRQVADDLLAAGQAATRLDGVTALQVQVRAAEVLLRAGERGDSLAVLRRTVRDAGPDADPRTRVAAAAVLAGAGDPAGAEALMMQALQARPGGYALFGGLVELSLRFAALGHFDQALRAADEAAAVAARLTGHGGRRVRDNPGARLRSLAELAREQILELQHGTPAGEADRADRRAGQHGRGQDLAKPGEGALSQPPWPVLAGSCLLWWPNAEYSRVGRQVPELRDVLGATWREHTARVESAMAVAADTAPAGSGAALSLAAAAYEKFVQYLERTGADPRLAPVMTAFTEHAGAGYEHAARWPPGQRDLCWCGSKKRYDRCCAA